MGRRRVAWHTGRPVGNAAGARAALYGALEVLSDDGLFKVAFRSADGRTVYKVPRYADRATRGRESQCRAEYAWSRAGRAAGIPGIPAVSIYAVDGMLVMAQSLFPHKSSWGSVSDDTWSAWRSLHIDDLHAGNYRFAESGEPYITDLAGYGNAYPAPGADAPPIITDDDGDWLERFPHLGPRDGDGEDEYESEYESEYAPDSAFGPSDSDPSDSAPEPIPSVRCTTLAARCHGKGAHNGAPLTARMLAHRVGHAGRCWHLDSAQHRADHGESTSAAVPPPYMQMGLWQGE